MQPLPAEVLDAIKRWEGLRLRAYRDFGGVLTCGWGHCGPDVIDGMEVDEAQAQRWFDADIATAASIVDRHVKVPLTEWARAALTSFVFNVGPGRKGVKDGFVELKKGGPSTLLRKLNAGDYTGAQREFSKWTKAKDKTTGERVELAGLVNRRAQEAAFFGREQVVTTASVDVEVSRPPARTVTAEEIAKWGGLGLAVASAVTQVIDGTATAIASAQRAAGELGGWPVWLGPVSGGLTVIAIGYLIYRVAKYQRRGEG